MSETNFADALRRLLAHEGGYSNHPADPGGPTKYGITIADYRRYINPNASAADVRATSVDAARKIYRERYWDVMRCDELPPGVDYAVFDYAVNSGVGRSGKVLRRVLGLGASMPAVTQPVIDAAARSSSQKIIVAICDERLRFLKSLKTWPTFGAGWGRRVAEVRVAALTMAQAQQVSAPASRPRRKSDAAVAVSMLSVIAGAVAASMHGATFWIVASLVMAIAAAGGIWWLLRFRQDKETA